MRRRIESNSADVAVGPFEGFVLVLIYVICSEGREQRGYAEVCCIFLLGKDCEFFEEPHSGGRQELYSIYILLAYFNNTPFLIYFTFSVHTFLCSICEFCITLGIKNILSLNQSLENISPLRGSCLRDSINIHFLFRSRESISPPRSSCLGVCVHIRFILGQILDDSGRSTHPKSGPGCRKEPKDKVQLALQSKAGLSQLMDWADSAGPKLTWRKYSNMESGDLKYVDSAFVANS